jgi:hypothetical protein
MIFIALPYNGWCIPQAPIACSQASGMHEVQCVPYQHSLLQHNFNILFCDAYNARQQDDITHFAMVHADIGPQVRFLDVMLEEMDRHGADVMSAVVPLKDDRDLTSTGIGWRGSWQVRRLAMTECLSMPRTFDLMDAMQCLHMNHEDPASHYLAINTGVWVADFRKPWVEEFPGFEIRSGIFRDKLGKKYPNVQSEDWLFGEWLATNGVKVMATRKVKLEHFGYKGFSNQGETQEKWTFDRNWRDRCAVFPEGWIGR